VVCLLSHIKCASTTGVKKRLELSKRKNSWRRNEQRSKRGRKPGDGQERSMIDRNKRGDSKKREESHGDTGTKRTSSSGSLSLSTESLHAVDTCTTICTKSVTYERAHYLVSLTSRKHVADFQRCAELLKTPSRSNIRKPKLAS
jgi:hypothetical protein